jgi:hypothetical protein
MTIKLADVKTGTRLSKCAWTGKNPANPVHRSSHYSRKKAILASPALGINPDRAVDFPDLPIDQIIFN